MSIEYKTALAENQLCGHKGIMETPLGYIYHSE